jgi:hypothetical protein
LLGKLAVVCGGAAIFGVLAKNMAGILPVFSLETK